MYALRVNITVPNGCRKSAFSSVRSRCDVFDSNRCALDAAEWHIHQTAPFIHSFNEQQMSAAQHAFIQPVPAEQQQQLLWSKGEAHYSIVQIPLWVFANRAANPRKLGVDSGRSMVYQFSCCCARDHQRIEQKVFLLSTYVGRPLHTKPADSSTRHRQTKKNNFERKRPHVVIVQ